MHCKLLLLTICITPWVLYVDGSCESLQLLGQQSEGSPLKCSHVCHPETGWKLVPLLWAPLNVDINCSSSSYTVLTAHSWDELNFVNASEVKWCGWDHVLNDPRSCHFQLSPLSEQYFGVQQIETGGLFKNVLPGAPVFSCEVNTTRQISPAHVAMTAVGVLLYYNAPALAMSTTFRLTSGSLMFMSGAIVVLAFIMFRSMPYKRSIAAIFTFSTSAMLAAVRWLYGTWLPDAHTVLLSRPFIGYLLVSGLVGLAVTYWLDDANNVKLNTTIRVTLQLTGLFMVYQGISDERVGLGAAVLLVLSRWLYIVARRLAWLGLWVVRMSYKLLAVTVSRLADAAGARRNSRSQQQVISGRRPAGGLQQTRQQAAEKDELLLSDEEPENSKRTRQQKQWRQQKYQDAEERNIQKYPSFDQWVLQADQHQRRSQSLGQGSPLHLRGGPPPSPKVPLAWRPQSCKQLMQQQQQQQWRQQQVSMAPQAAAAPAAVGAAAHASGGYQFPSTGQRSSPWSEQLAVEVQPVSSPPWSEQLAVDVRQRDERLSSPDTAAAQEAEAGVGGEVQQEGNVSQLVAMGKILNPGTGRPISIRGPKYKELVSQGYQPDLENGVLLPPHNAPDSAWAGVGLSSQRTPPFRRSQPSGSSRQTPSSNTRQRRNGRQAAQPM